MEGEIELVGQSTGEGLASCVWPQQTARGSE
jgi:hypothetical protein